MKITIVGLGYVGLPTAAVLADAALQRGSEPVTGVDIDPAICAAVNSGRAHLVEPGLDDVLARVAGKSLHASTEVPASDVFVLAVPTPFTEDKQADLSYLKSAALSVAPVLTGGELIIIESTIPPQATAQTAQWVHEARPDLHGRIDFAHCPERVLPGQVLRELVENGRVIGGLTPGSAERARDVYAQFCTGELLLTDALTAEMVKLSENSFRDVNIAFANELSLICDRLGADVWELIRLANHHPRVEILQPGPGVGGHCISVDPWFIVAAAPDLARVIRTAREVNDAKPHWVVARVIDAARARADRGRLTIALLGLAYKKNIDDLRESPSVEIAALVARALPEARILAVEPHVDALPGELADYPNLDLATNTDVVAEADVVALLVDHDAFHQVTVRPDAGVIDTIGRWRG